MSLPWFRMDSNIAHHDKVLWLIKQPNGWRAYACYTFAIGYANGQGTDGIIPDHALSSIHATTKIAHLLVEARLFDHHERGYTIHNFSTRNEVALTSEIKRRTKQLAGIKSQCVQRHGPECGCWKAAPNV